MDIASLAIAIKTGDIQKARNELEKLEDQGKKTEKATDAMAIGYGIAAGSIVAAVFAIGKASVNAAIEAENASNKMQAVLKATGYAAGLTKNQLDDMADSMAASTKFDDESIRNASSVLLTFRNVQGETFERGIKLAADLASVLGTDLTSASLQLGKALNDPVSGISALGRAGVQFTEVQKDQIKHFVETNQLAKAQEIILGELQSQVGGTAEAMNVGLTKAINDSTKAWGELFEALGKSKEVQGVVIAFSETSTSALQSLTKEINKTGSAWSGLVDFAFKPFDINLLGFKDAAKVDDDLERISKRYASIGADKQKAQQEADFLAIQEKKRLEDQAKLDKESAKERLKYIEDDMRGWVQHADVVLEEGERIAEEERKQADERNKYAEMMRQKDLEGWVKYAEQRVQDDLTEAQMLAKLQSDESEKAKKDAKEWTTGLETDLKSAFMMAFQASKDPAQAFLDGFANAVFSRVSASLASAFADAAMKKMSAGGGDMLGSLISAFGGGGNAGVNMGTATGADMMAAFDGGGFTGSGSRSGGMDGRGGFAAMLHPNETVIDHTKGQGAGSIVYSPIINVDSRADRGDVMRIIQQAVANGNAQLVDKLQRQGRI